MAQTNWLECLTRNRDAIANRLDAVAEVTEQTRAAVRRRKEIHSFADSVWTGVNT